VRETEGSESSITDCSVTLDYKLSPVCSPDGIPLIVGCEHGDMMVCENQVWTCVHEEANGHEWQEIVTIEEEVTPWSPPDCEVCPSLAGPLVSFLLVGAALGFIAAALLKQLDR